MNPNPDQVLTALESRLKLLRRHMQEWKALLVQQRQVRHGILQPVQALVKPDVDERMAKLEYITQRANRLTGLAMRHAEQWQQLRARHQQEAVDLEEILATHKTA